MAKVDLLVEKFPSKMCAVQLFRFLVSQAKHDGIWELLGLTYEEFNQKAKNFDPDLFEELLDYYIGFNSDLLAITNFIVKTLTKEKKVSALIDVSKIWNKTCELVWQLVELDGKLAVTKEELMENEELFKNVCEYYKIKLPITDEERIKIRKKIFYLKNKQKEKKFKSGLIDEIEDKEELGEENLDELKI